MQVYLGQLAYFGQLAYLGQLAYVGQSGLTALEFYLSPMLLYFAFILFMDMFV